jgi:hypothetical protein
MSSLKVVFVVLLCWAMSTALILAQNLYIIERDDLYGFSDKSGDLVIPPMYGAVKPFSEGLAPVYQNGGWGFIDAGGRMKIGLGFLHADIFSDEIAAVHLKEGWGYIDKVGKLVIEPRFSQARRFSEGVAPVKSDHGWLFINKAGTIVEGLTGFEEAKNFSGGLAAVHVGGRWRFITHEGKKKFDLEFAKVSDFNEGLAAVQEEENGKFGFIDSFGNYAIRPVFDDARPFSEGVAAVRVSGRWGYIDKKGELRIPNNYPFFADEFVGGLAAVSDPVRGTKMYINADGKPQFFKSTKPLGTERTTVDYAMCSIKFSSTPPGAVVYLIPAYIWDQGERNRPAPSTLQGTDLREYLNVNFNFKIPEGPTNVEARDIPEQTYVALFLLGGEMQLLRLKLHPAGESASVSFEHK